VIINGQKAFGKQASLYDVFAYYRLKLEGRFPMVLVLNALHIYTDRHDDLPNPANLIEIMAPAPKKITTAEFIHAKEQHKLEGYPAHGYYGTLISNYERQEADERAPVVDMHPKLRERLQQALIEEKKA